MTGFLARLILLLLLASALAGEADALTLSECLEMARMNSPALKTAAWDTRIAEENVRLAKAAGYPRLDVQAGYTMQLEPQAVIINGRTAETQEPDYVFAGLAATYTLYDFGRRDARRRQSLKIAESTRNMFSSRQQDVSLQVIETYYGILEAGRLVKAAAEEVTQVSEHRRVAQELYDQGVVTRNDVLQADVRLASARQKLMMMNNRVDNGWLRLNYMISMEPSFREELEDISGKLPALDPPADDYEALAVRPDLNALRRGVEAGSFAVKEARGGYFPEIFTRLALDYAQNDKVREQAILSATIGLRLNLFDGYATSAAREKAIRERSRKQDALRQAEAQARLEIATAQNDARVARERVLVSETAIRQSEENLRINRERYRERVGTATEVLDAQTLLTEARTEYYRAFYDYQTASARVKRATGEL